MQISNTHLLARIINDDIKSLELLDVLVDHHLTMRLFHEIALDDMYLRTTLLDHLLCVLGIGTFLGKVSYGDTGCSLTSEHNRYSPTDPRVTTSDDGGFVL